MKSDIQDNLVEVKFPWRKSIGAVSILIFSLWLISHDIWGSDFIKIFLIG